MSKFKRWMLENNKRAVDIASKARIGFSTVQKALRGEPVSPIIAEALSRPTGLPTSDFESPQNNGDKASA